SIRSTTSSRPVPSLIGPIWAAATFIWRAMVSSSGARTLPLPRVAGHAAARGPRAATAALASTTMHTLVFLDPGHFHAALTLRERHPLVRDEIVVYAPTAEHAGGAELAEFLTLVEAFNRRPERPTQWQP